MSQAAKTLQAIKYTPGDPGSLQILNQLELPHKTIFENVETCKDGHAAIQTMKTRGAPAIAIVAALSLVIHAKNEASRFTSPGDAREFLIEKLEYLETSRPTAVNLFDAAAKLKVTVKDASAANNATPSSVVNAYVVAAEKMLESDVIDNMNIGRYGADYVRFHAKDKNNIQVLTHCNTGSLATAGWGTALGIIRQLFKDNTLTRAYCTETRPYNQGSRLTAYELKYEEIPVTLVCDSMVSALLKQNEVQAIIVGADRVARNGDTANKIGTYQLAITARYHGIPFIVAAPTTSIDLHTAHGNDIKIEERPANELVYTTGVQDIDNVLTPTTVRTAPEGIDVWNPSFDVTPSSLISAIITEKGTAVKSEDATEFDMAAFVALNMTKA